MTEAQWLACRTSRKMLAFLQGRLSQRKALLIGCACCRLHWSEITLAEYRSATEILERMADGVASEQEIAEGRRVANYALDMHTGTIRGIPRRYKTRAAGCGAWAVREMFGPDHLDAESVDSALAHLWYIGKSPSVGARRHSRVVRDICGNPFRPVAFDPEWLTSDVLLLARGIYEERAFDRMPILADALQDAGCDNDDILNHLRDAKQTHVRGCWAVDLVLGKE
ncbi:MAG: hypothetical protein L0241_07860 [Planctomycetia bacterium]|nr:hypothetical protein [Planctomycetia bacterium]